MYSSLSGDALKQLGSVFSLAHDLGFTVKRVKSLAEAELMVHLELVGKGLEQWREAASELPGLTVHASQEGEQVGLR